MTSKTRERNRKQFRAVLRALNDLEGAATEFSSHHFNGNASLSLKQTAREKLVDKAMALSALVDGEHEAVNKAMQAQVKPAVVRNC